MMLSHIREQAIRPALALLPAGEPLPAPPADRRPGPRQFERGGGCVMGTDGKLLVRYFNGSWVDVGFSSFTFAIGTAYRVAIRFNSSTSISLLVNGSLVETKTVSGLPFTGAITVLRLGGVLFGDGVPFFGDLDEFAIIPSLLSDAQIAALETAALG